MKKIVLVPALLGVMGLGGLVAVAGGDQAGFAKAPEKLSASQIEKKALAVVKGKITELELEKEGKKLYYEVEVTTRDAEYDLLFDAYTGELLKKKKDDDDDRSASSKKAANQSSVKSDDDWDDRYDDDDDDWDDRYDEDDDDDDNDDDLDD